MTSVNTLTGRNGKFTLGTASTTGAHTAVARTSQWTVDPALATKNEWGDSDSNGYTNRSAGRRDATFSAEGKYDSGTEVFDVFQPEDILAATLWLSGSVALLYYHFPIALCDTFNLVVNIDTEEVIGWTSSWGADGKFWRPGEAGAPVITVA